jgi:hypothetical protein
MELLFATRGAEHEHSTRMQGACWMSSSFCMLGLRADCDSGKKFQWNPRNCIPAEILLIGPLFVLPVPKFSFPADSKK